MDLEYYKRYEPIFNSWRIKRELGQGSFGVVFEIEREVFTNTEKAALKAISIPRSQSEVRSRMSDGMDEKNVTDYFRNFVEEIANEFVLMSKLKGKSNIVSYEDHAVIEHADGIGWDILIRMELLRPFNEYAKTANLTRKDVIQLGIDMCKALELCQKYNIIHRDIKPENIFVADNGDFKLGDFGIARTIEKASSGLSKKGTYLYMAPEIYRGEQYGPAVDICSLGLVMYRLLNENRLPFIPLNTSRIMHQDYETALMKRISGAQIPNPKNADGRLAEIVLKACAYNTGDRYSSPMQMREELSAILYSQNEVEIIYPQGDGLILKSDNNSGTQVLPVGLETIKKDNVAEDTPLPQESSEDHKSSELAFEDNPKNNHSDSTTLFVENKNKNRFAFIAVAGIAIVGLIIGVVFIFGKPKMPDVYEANAPNTSGIATDETNDKAADSINELASSSVSEIISDDIYSFQFVFDSILYELPMTYSDFISRGWTMVDEVGTLSPNTATSVFMHKNGEEIRVYLINLSINQLSYDECLVGGVKIDSLYGTIDTASIFLPQGIQYGVSGLDDILLAYGEPSEKNESEYDSDFWDTCVVLRYTYGNYQEIELEIVDNVLTEITMENYVVPDDFDYGNINEETPEAIRNYKRPTTLGDNLLDFTFSIEGDYYAMPFPVSEMIAYGWKIDETNLETIVASNDYEWVRLRKENKSFVAMVHNNATSATSPDNCWIKSIEIFNPDAFEPQDGLSAHWKLPLGLSSSMGKDELEYVLKDVKHERQVTDKFVYYGIFLDETETFDTNFRNHIIISYNVDSQKVWSVIIDHQFD